MTDASTTEKEMLARYLRAGRDALLWKLDGLTEREVRLPMTRTGTNLLGIVKHVGSVTYGYFGDCFGRPAPEPVPWFEDGAEENADMWATADQSRDDIVGFYRRAWTHADRTIEELDLDAVGTVPWWGERGSVTLRRIMVHMIDETAHHAGHADIVRELIDGGVGLRANNANLPEHDDAWWADYRARLQRTADGFSG